MTTSVSKAFVEAQLLLSNFILLLFSLEFIRGVNCNFNHLEKLNKKMKFDSHL